MYHRFTFLTRYCRLRFLTRIPGQRRDERLESDGWGKGISSRGSLPSSFAPSCSSASPSPRNRNLAGSTWNRTGNGCCSSSTMHIRPRAMFRYPDPRVSGILLTMGRASLPMRCLHPFHPAVPSRWIPLCVHRTKPGPDPRPSFVYRSSPTRSVRIGETEANPYPSVTVNHTGRKSILGNDGRKGNP